MLRLHRLIEILCLAALAFITLLGVCWGPPGPPRTPVGNMEMYVISGLGVVLYGAWKMRK